MFKKRVCPTRGDRHKYIGIKKRYLEGFFLITDIWIGFEIIYKCGNGHWWTKHWSYATPNEYNKWREEDEYG